MALAPGAKLGPYEIRTLIGKGGMGEVYLATDTRLHRDVAIKVASEQFSERFEREARTIASLNHPNICHLYDVGPNYLVMEFVEGPTLAARLQQGPLPLEEALQIAGQIADGLQAAHEKGIVHRDLKPGNVNLTSEGAVKVLDFGLAKLRDTGAAESTSDQSPTLTLEAATRAGAIMGTAAYMAPEQARGKKVDERADIWAFGVVLFEMVTAQKLFKGEDLAETLAAVIKEEPRLDQVPAKVQRLIRACLQKDPARRLRSIADWRLLLENEAPATAIAASTGIRRWIWPAVAAIAAMAFAITLVAYRRAKQPLDHPLMQFDVDLGADVSLPEIGRLATGGSAVAISPDGTRLTYVSGSPPRLFTRRLDASKAVELPGTEGAYSPFFSPDGKWIGFLTSGNKLNKISVVGGAVVSLASFAQFGGTSWGEDGGIIVCDQTRGLVRIPEAGGASELIARPAKGELALGLPQILPGGKAILFARAVSFDADQNTIEVLTLADHRRKIVARGGTTPRYLSSSAGVGHLIYARGATLFAVPFDLEKLETRGTPVPVLDDIAFNGSSTSQFSVSRTGTFVYRRATNSGTSQTSALQWVDTTGKREPLRVKPGMYFSPSVSPDGKRIAMVANEGGSRDIWIYDTQRDSMTRVTFDGGIVGNPVWSPDGKFVVFNAAPNSIYQARADGATQPQPLVQGGVNLIPRSFAPDGKRLAYSDLLTGLNQLWSAPLEDQGGQLKAGRPEQFQKSLFANGNPTFSPDGRWLAYQSNESGRTEIYVRAFPPPSSGQGGKWQISNTGGTNPHWSRTAHDLIYQSGDQLMAAGYSMQGNTFVPEKPRVWIGMFSALSSFAGPQWDLAPDGKRVLAVIPLESATQTPKAEHEVVMLQNFFDELRRKVPIEK